MNPKIPFLNLADRHPGISAGIGLGYEEAARVCLDRHHTSPTTLQVRDNANETLADADWAAADQQLRDAHNNEIDATEAGAYALAIACVELNRGLLAVRRAETLTGADYYLDAPDAPPGDLEKAIRLEVSGTSEGTVAVIESRLKTKLQQAANGNSNLPAMAVVVGFAQRRIVCADVENS